MQEQYLDLRNCTDSALDIKRVRYIGLLNNPFDCNSTIIWFEENKDFKIITYETDTIDINREDVNSDLALTQTIATNMTWGKVVEIQANDGSEFLQFIDNINANERFTDKNGKGIIAYSNGGIWFKEEVILNEAMTTEFRQSYVYPNLKTDKWLNPLSGNKMSDSVNELSFLIEDFPKYYWSGFAPTGLATPTGLEPIEITYGELTLTATELTIPTLTVVDTDGLIDPNVVNKVLITLYDKATGEELFSEAFTGDGTDAVITFDFATITNVTIAFEYYLTDEIKVPFKTADVTKGAIL